MLIGLLSLWVKQGHSEDTTTTTKTTSSASSTTITTTKPTLVFVEPMKNYSKLAGESLKIRCVVQGQPPASTIKWYKNEAPLIEEKGRVRIRSKTGSGGDTQWSRIRFSDLETMDTGYYKCEAYNGLQTISSETVIKVHLGNKRKYCHKCKEKVRACLRQPRKFTLPKPAPSTLPEFVQLWSQSSQEGAPLWE